MSSLKCLGATSGTKTQFPICAKNQDSTSPFFDCTFHVLSANLSGKNAQHLPWALKEKSSQRVFRLQRLPFELKEVSEKGQPCPSLSRHYDECHILLAEFEASPKIDQKLF